MTRATRSFFLWIRPAQAQSKSNVHPARILIHRLIKNLLDRVQLLESKVSTGPPVEVANASRPWPVVPANSLMRTPRDHNTVFIEVGTGFSTVKPIEFYGLPLEPP